MTSGYALIFPCSLLRGGGAGLVLEEEPGHGVAGAMGEGTLLARADEELAAPGECGVGLPSS